MVIKLALAPDGLETAKIPINIIDKSEILLDAKRINADTIKKIVNHLKQKAINYKEYLKMNISIIMYRDISIDDSDEFIEGAIIKGIQDKIFEYTQTLNFDSRESYIDEIIKKIEVFVKLSDLKTSFSKYRVATLAEALSNYSDAEKQFIEIIHDC